MLTPSAGQSAPSPLAAFLCQHIARSTASAPDLKAIFARSRNCVLVKAARGAAQSTCACVSFPCANPPDRARYFAHSVFLKRNCSINSRRRRPNNYVTISSHIRRPRRRPLKPAGATATVASRAPRLESSLSQCLPPSS